MDEHAYGDATTKAWNPSEIEAGVAGLVRTTPHFPPKATPAAGLPQRFGKVDAFKSAGVEKRAKAARFPVRTDALGQN
jgi:hypothetical protein